MFSFPRSSSTIPAAAFVLLLLPPVIISPVLAQDATADTHRILTYKPAFLPPDEILAFLGVDPMGGRGVLDWQDAGDRHSVDLRANSAANLLVLAGAPADVALVETMIRAADVAPRQIDIEVKILEISSTRARDAGIDWQNLIEGSDLGAQWALNDRHDETTQNSTERINDNPSSTRRLHNETQTDGQTAGLSARAEFSRVLHLLDSKGALTTRQVPRILTLNNRRGTILDGSRVTYVTRYSSYTNLFATDSLDAGLTLSVLPSLGESGYITLHISAEVTALVDQISGSPVKTGQMLENTVVVKNGESVVLGGLTGFREHKLQRRFPVLGHVLPFLFSREVSEREEIRSFMVLTPKVVDFTSNVDPDMKEAIEGE
jgi:type II secretory pathway component GspD/PulD (secretin)